MCIEMKQNINIDINVKTTKTNQPNKTTKKTKT